MIIYGWGTKTNPLGVTDLIHCDRCGNTGPWLIYQAKKQFKLYWIPVAQWNKRIVAECSTCPNAFIIPPEKLDEVLSQDNESNPENTAYQNTTRSSSTPPPRPKKNLCTSCGRRLKGNEKFCEFCGTKI